MKSGSLVPKRTSNRLLVPHPFSAVSLQYQHRNRTVVYDVPTLCRLTHGLLCHQICLLLLSRRDENELYFLNSSLKRTYTHSRDVHDLFFPVPQYPVFPVSCSQRRTRLDTGHKEQALQEGCRVFACKLSFQTQQKGHN
ncbi:hypothetical protein TNCV_2761651 [Trichonephila clavipes]|nr:hypothetical protein TNCV_2761651 [Trichonephila clavipes]